MTESASTMENQSAEKNKSLSVLVVILGALTAFAPLSIDMYLSSFPKMADDFGVTIARVELSLASFFVGLSLGQLLYGTVTDKFGRKKPLYVGLIIYIIASVVCALSPNIYFLIAARFLQALGACAGIVIARAAVRDLFDYQESARVFSLLMLVMGVAPILAPLIGGYVMLFFGWRAIFYFVALFSAICLFAVVKYLPETKEPNPEVKLSRTFNTYFNVAKNKEFIGYALAGGFAQAGMFAYITGSPFVFIELFHVPSERYGWFFGFNALGLITLSQINGRLLRSNPPMKILRMSLISVALIGLALILTSVFKFGFWAIAALLFLYVASLGMIVPNAMASALSKQHEHAGSASALIGTIQYTLAALASSLVSYFNNGTTLSMALFVGGNGIAAFLIYKLLISQTPKDDSIYTEQNPIEISVG